MEKGQLRAEPNISVRRPGTTELGVKTELKNINSFRNLYRAIDFEVKRQIDPSGEVNDSASPELARLRTQLRKQRTRLRSTLESYLRGKETAKYLQDQVISDRDGRYVLVVKAEHRTSIPGIIHGSSASGASLYLEPLSTVEINNDEGVWIRRYLLEKQVGALPDGRHTQSVSNLHQYPGSGNHRAAGVHAIPV